MKDVETKKLGKRKTPISPGRKPYIVNWDIVDSHFESHCTGSEVANLLGITQDTLANHCKKHKNMTMTDYMLLKREKGKSNIKQKQYRLALEGDRGMLIWLGKNWLGQKDNHDINITGNVNISIVHFGDNPKPLPYISTNEAQITHYEKEINNE